MKKKMNSRIFHERFRFQQRSIYVRDTLLSSIVFFFFFFSFCLRLKKKKICHFPVFMRWKLVGSHYYPQHPLPPPPPFLCFLPRPLLVPYPHLLFLPSSYFTALRISIRRKEQRHRSRSAISRNYKNARIIRANPSAIQSSPSGISKKLYVMRRSGTVFDEKD